MGRLVTLATLIGAIGAAAATGSGLPPLSVGLYGAGILTGISLARWTNRLAQSWLGVR